MTERADPHPIPTADNRCRSARYGGRRMRKNPPPSMNLTPLVDIVFLLIVFFMLATGFIDRDYIPLRFPALSDQVPPTKDTLVHLEIIDRETLQLDGKKIDPSRLMSVLTAGKAERDIHAAHITTSRTIPLQHVITIMDIVRDVGIDHISIVARKG